MAGVNGSRRNFLNRALVALGLLAVAEATWVALSALGGRRRDVSPVSAEGLFEAGSAGRFAPGSVTPFRDGGFYLVRLEDGGFLALHRKCTHLGCTVSWLPDERRFACPCHASAFSVQGRVLSAPAPRPLDRFPVSVNGGIVFVDTTRRSRQDPDKSRQGVAAS